MPGRYTITAEPEILQSRFNVTVPEAYKKRHNAAPTQALPVIISSEPDQLLYLYWGLIPSWSKNKDVATKLINARADSLLDKVSFKKSFETRRCIVPADAFYEWKPVGKKSKIPYRIGLNSNELFSMAGLWESSENTNGQEIQTFTIITTEANSLVAQVHDRMPVLLTKETEKIWMNPNEKMETLLPLLKPFENSAMTSYAVSSRVNNVANDGPDLITPVPPADQFGNYSLFD